MRNLIAALMLACLGIMLPAMAGPLRFCLIEECLLIATEESDCCPDCDRSADQPCCVDLDALPDAAPPQLALELPPVTARELPAIAIPAALESDHRLKSGAKPIRGPASPTAHRAVLGIWRL